MKQGGSKNTLQNLCRSENNQTILILIEVLICENMGDLTLNRQSLPPPDLERPSNSEGFPIQVGGGVSEAYLETVRV